MAYCTNCGVDLPEHALLCPTCQHPTLRPHIDREPSRGRATFGQRLVAALIDGALLFVVDLIVTAIFPDGDRLLATAAGLAYYTYLEGSPAGQTVGKRVMNIRVIRAADGGPLGFGLAVVRYLGRIVSAIVFLLGYFWMLWDPEKQTWHDKFAGTLVVPTSEHPVHAWPG